MVEVVKGRARRWKMEFRVVIVEVGARATATMTATRAAVKNFRMGGGGGGVDCRGRRIYKRAVKYLCFWARQNDTNCVYICMYMYVLYMRRCG